MNISKIKCDHCGKEANEPLNPPWITIKEPSTCYSHGHGPIAISEGSTVKKQQYGGFHFCNRSCLYTFIMLLPPLTAPSDLRCM